MERLTISITFSQQRERRVAADIVKTFVELCRAEKIYLAADSNLNSFLRVVRGAQFYGPDRLMIGARQGYPGRDGHVMD